MADEPKKWKDGDPDRRKKENEDLRFAVQARLIAHRRIKEQEAESAPEPKQRRRLL